MSKLNSRKLRRIQESQRIVTHGSIGAFFGIPHSGFVIAVGQSLR